MTFVVIEYPRGHLSGGLGDRVVGLCSAIVLANMLGKRLLIKWDTPSIKNVLTLGSHDFYSVKPSLANAVRVDAMNHRWKVANLFMKENLINKWRGKTVVLQCNQDIAYFLYRNPTWTNKSSTYEQHLMNAYQSVFTTYLKPVRNSANATLTNTSYAAIQIRAGDKYMGVGGHQPIKDVPSAMRTLAAQLKTLVPTTHAIYVSSDHPNSKTLLQRELSEYKVIDNAQSRVHLERSKSSSTNQLQALISDLFTLSTANILIISNYSNYGRMAALMQQRGTTVRGFDPPNFAIRAVVSSSLFAKPDGAQLRVSNTARPAATRRAIVRKPAAKPIAKPLKATNIRPTTGLRRRVVQLRRLRRIKK